MFTHQLPQKISGRIYFGRRTKELIKKVPPGSILLLDHEDLDEMAALSLIQKKIKAVLNCAPSMTGKYASRGTLKLNEAKIPVYDLLEFTQLKLIEQGDWLLIREREAWLEKNKAAVFLSKLISYTPQLIQQKLELAQNRATERIRLFTENTLHHALKEIDEIFKPLTVPKLRKKLVNQQVIVVSRGHGYFEDLLALKPYLDQQKPVLIGVDGGADALVECGYQPDIIIGDMDSVSEGVLRSGAELIVHAYTTGKAPGLKRVQEHHLPAHIFPCFGTSEDAAYLLADHAGATLIVSIGSHNNMIDFLEKGRQGMGSTLLVRLKLGEKLIDAKGLHLLSAERRIPSWILLASSSLPTMKRSE